jgi:hypothetical protein
MHERPAWSDRNLVAHHAKRLREDTGCFEDLLGIAGREMTADEYRDRSEQRVARSWCEYEGQGWDRLGGAHTEARAHFVDDDLVVGITDLARTAFVTCFHEHFDRRRPLHGNHPGRGVSVAQRRIRYRENLRLKERGRPIINLRIIRDGQPQK